MDYQDALNALTNAAALEQVWRERLNPELQLQAMRAFLQRSGLADVSGVDDSDSESWSDCSLGLESENLLASSDSSDGKKLENPRQARKSQKDMQEAKVNTISDEMMVSSEQEDCDDQEDDDDTEEEGDEKEPLTVKHCEKGAKRKWDKRQYCVYCEKPQSKIARHLERKHKHEKDVATC
ncbi:hypothetical protein GJAV_G00039580 [Gymnothorax javanicus]|nr:hypothetical protein GJAV_G00039580 [Gymnothorax javanicus]